MTNKGKPFFDGLKFHRVIKTSWLRWGPSGNGSGGPGYAFMVHRLEHNKPGSSLANSGPTTSMEASFHYTPKKLGWAETHHFGHVTEGMNMAKLHCTKRWR
jgi:cyclophilin family peptidyl-prolyl cis-trans isomerase